MELVKQRHRRDQRVGRVVGQQYRLAVQQAGGGPVGSDPGDRMEELERRHGPGIRPARRERSDGRRLRQMPGDRERRLGQDRRRVPHPCGVKFRPARRAENVENVEKQRTFIQYCFVDKNLIRL